MDYSQIDDYRVQSEEPLSFRKIRTKSGARFTAYLLKDGILFQPMNMRAEFAMWKMTSRGRAEGAAYVLHDIVHGYLLKRKLR